MFRPPNPPTNSLLVRNYPIIPVVNVAAYNHIHLTYSNIIERHISSTSQQPPAGTNLSFSAAKSPHVSRKGGHTDRRTSCGEPKEAAEIFQGIFFEKSLEIVG